MTKQNTKNANPYEKYSEQEILAPLSDEWQPTSKLAKIIGCDPYTLRIRYHALADAGKIERMDMGRAYLWRKAQKKPRK